MSIKMELNSNWRSKKISGLILFDLEVENF